MSSRRFIPREEEAAQDAVYRELDPQALEDGESESSTPVPDAVEAPWGTKPEDLEGVLESLENVVDFAYERGYHEHGVPLVGVVREYVARLVSALREARRENDAMRAQLALEQGVDNELREELADLRAEIERTSLALGDGPYSSISEHAAALKMELAIEQQKDHAYQSWTNGYDAAIEDYRENRTALWPKRKRRAASRVPETEDRQ